MIHIGLLCKLDQGKRGLFLLNKIKVKNVLLRFFYLIFTCQV